ncbi:dioxygenase [Seongchinamella sediminis]|uniref:Dioxygenase n=1 Tax=Seongchinamella sediminis TaxID=2283635 RepID=A0A3L7DTA4_9GAMM|nr:carotenoid oxygenase family protein [Seongchinamella sediminis]RLQ20296.1 dioxygenase [Seongchinamella sediminis]
MNDSNYPITDEAIGGVTHFDNAPRWIYEVDNPYLHGVYAPTTDEVAAENLEVIGELPDDLFGAYYRNGPNTVHKPQGQHHPFDGDGMIHAVYFRDGKASYHNSYIHTAGYLAEQAAGKAIWPGVMGTFDFSLPDFPIRDTCNTDVTLYAGNLMPTWYHSGRPYKMDPLTLENLGEYTLPGGRIRRNMSAHNKVDWNTGEMLFMDYFDDAPYMTYGVGNPDGTLRQEIPIDLPGPRRPHDLGFTTNYTILHDLPFFHDANVLRRHGKMVLEFHRDMPARFGIIPRYGSSGDIRWFECEPCFILHVSNCWEDGDWVVMDGCRSVNPLPEPAGGGELAHMLSYMRNETNNYRWRFNMATGEVREGDIDTLNTEFNKTNQLFHGVKSKYAYHQRIPLLDEGGHTLRFDSLVKYNNETGQYDQWDYGEGVFGSESPFAPVKGATRDNDEDDGYVVTMVTDSNTWKSEALVFDARDITQGPIARVQLPHRVPAGFHAWWGRGEDLYATD